MIISLSFKWKATMEDDPLCVSKILPWPEQGAGHSLA